MVVRKMYAAVACGITRLTDPPPPPSPPAPWRERCCGKAEDRAVDYMLQHPYHIQSKWYTMQVRTLEVLLCIIWRCVIEQSQTVRYSRNGVVYSPS